jgi:site-specific DNA recombinase
MADRYTQFFELARSYTHLDELDRDALVTFVDRIEIGPKIYENGNHKVPARANQPYRQSVRIFCKFIGELTESSGKCSVERPA